NLMSYVTYSQGYKSGAFNPAPEPGAPFPLVVQKEGTSNFELGLKSVLLDRLDLIDEYKFLVHPRIAGHGPTLYQSGLPSTRRLELVSAKPFRSGAVA